MAIHTVAFIGLGVMGYPMAGHLAAAGHRLRVYNRTSEKAARWVTEHEGEQATTPAGVAEGADFVLACVGNDDDLRSVVLGDEGAFAGMAKGAVFVDHTTASADVARELDGIAREHGVGFLDAPVSGGQAGAENGQLTVMAGGDAEVFARAEPLMRAYGRAVTLMGPVGAGQLTKMANQICIAGLVQGLSEGLNFAERAGLDGKQVVDVISKGAAGSWQMENRGATMLDDEFEFGFAVDWMCKDLDIALREGARNGAHLPVTALVEQFYREVQTMGGGRWDTSSLIRRLRRDA
jgi:3-hydroxyisobutyrate dehydrogenase